MEGSPQVEKSSGGILNTGGPVQVVPAADSVGIKLDSHRIGVELTEIDPILKHMLLVFGLNVHFAEA